MKRILSKLSYLAVVVTLQQSHASDITKVDSFNDIPFGSFTPQECIGYDLDDTTFVPANRIMRNANLAARNEFIESIRKEKGNERVTFAYDHSPYELVEYCFLEHLSKLAARKVDTIGFTVRRTGIPTHDAKTTVQGDTLKILSHLGVKFSSNHLKDIVLEGMNPLNPEYSNYVVDRKLKPFETTQDAMIKNQVIFTNNLDKGLVLGRLFALADFFPVTFIFIDDKTQNLESVRDAITTVNATYKKDIKFRGYHYVGASKLNNQLIPEVVGYQKKSLLTDNPEFYTDDQAADLVTVGEIDWIGWDKSE